LHSVKKFARGVLRSVPALERRLLPSSGYRLIDRAEAERLQASASGWQSARSAAWQQRAYDRLLVDMAAGHPRGDLMVAAEAVDAAGLDRPDLLELGCGGGYHSTIFAALCACKPAYRGADYSQEMIDGARRRFPGVSFDLADTTALPYPDASADLVFEGVSLMHILDWKQALAEIARVARHAAIFHCVPVFDEARPTQYLFKYAYGEPVTEAVYDREELEAALRDAGLAIERSWHAEPYDVHGVAGSQSHARTYLCRKTH
jgi:ubiquinone/menaquinone biosynthesis C-methylase UbiE